MSDSVPNFLNTLYKLDLKAQCSKSDIKTSFDFWVVFGPGGIQ